MDYLNIFLLLLAALFTIALYFMCIKPYLLVLSIKKQFEQKGYCVLVQPLNFFKERVLQKIQQQSILHRDALYHQKQTYQGFDVSISNSFFKIFITLNSVELVKEAYNKIEHLQKNSIMKNNFKRLYGGGLVMEEGKVWKNKRKVYSQIFNFKLLQELHPTISKVVDQSLNQWSVISTSQNKDVFSIDVSAQLKKLFFNIFVQSYFGRQFQEFSYKQKNYSQVLVNIFEQMFHQSFTLRHIAFGTKILQKGWFGNDKEIQQQVQVIKIQTKQFVTKRAKQIEQGSKQNEQNIISKLINSQQFKNSKGDQRKKLIQSITGDVLIFFFAGTDTTSSVLTLTLHILNKRPQIVQKLLQELGKDNQQDYSSNTIKSWKYMSAVLNQTLRMYGPANWIFIRSIQDNCTQIGGVALPEGASLSIQSNTIHFDKQYYQKPHQFMPERWFEPKHQNPFSFISFGGGQRNCIGQHLARIQYKIALAKLLRKFSFKTKDQIVMHVPFVYTSKHNYFELTQKLSN